MNRCNFCHNNSNIDSTNISVDNKDFSIDDVRQALADRNYSDETIIEYLYSKNIKKGVVAKYTFATTPFFYSNSKAPVYN